MSKLMVTEPQALRQLEFDDAEALEKLADEKSANRKKERLV